MKLLSAENDTYVFHLVKREKELLTRILKQYPVIPSAHHKLSKSHAPADNPNQRLLDEALAEQRNENKKLVDAFLKDPQRFHDTQTHTRMKLAATETEWLLQVLNDVRVGHWILSGSPEELPYAQLTDPPSPHELAMDLAGYFQMSLLQALNKNP